MDGTEKSVLLEVYVRYIKEYSNFVRRCPLTGNNSVENLPLNAQIFGGQLLPAGRYYYETIVHINGVQGLTYKVYFNVPAGKTIFDDAMG